ncbi:MAG: hypothetical protein KKB50_08755 [Planctomycetes bacterium]|nr:hypothetical protein [Planctomycetota bacterium]
MAKMTPTRAVALAERRRGRFASCFGGRHRVFLAVIHVRDEEQALRVVGVARGGGADGVFLVNQGIGYQKLLRIARAVVARHRDLFVGVSCLDLRPQDVFCRLPECVSGVWADDTGSCSNVPDNAAAVRAARRDAGWRGLYFGTVTLGNALRDVVEACVAAGEHIDVLTVRSRAAREPPDVDVLRALHEVRARPPLAVVFDATPDSVGAYLPYVDCVLAAPAPDDGSCEPDPAHVPELSRTIHAYSEH